MHLRGSVIGNNRWLSNELSIYEDRVEEKVPARFVWKAVMGKHDKHVIRELIEERLVAHRDGRPAVAPAPVSTADELSKLAALRDSGVLSDEEFASAKRQLLGQAGKTTKPPQLGITHEGPGTTVRGGLAFYR